MQTLYSIRDNLEEIVYIGGVNMNTESLRNDVLVPAVAKTLDIAAKAKPTKDELCTTAKITAAVAVATAVVSLAVQAVLRNR